MKNLKNTKNILVAMSLVAMAACSPAKSPRVEMRSDKEILEAKMGPTDSKERYYLNQVMVMVKPSNQSDLAAKKDEEDRDLSAVLEDASAKNNLNLHVLDKIVGQPIYLLAVENNVNVPEAIETLKADSRIVMAQKNYQIRLSDAGGPTTQKSEQPAKFKAQDALFDTQWSLNNHGQEAPSGLAGKRNADMGIDASTDTTGSSDVVVGVIDTGIDYTHEDLAITETRNGVKIPVSGNIWVNPKEIPGNGIDDDNNGDSAESLNFVDDVYGYNFAYRTGDPRDDQGHGTHVSGTIGALRGAINSFKGVSGIAQNVSLMGLKFLTESGSGSTMDAVQAIYYAIGMKKRFPNKKFILSNSWGGSRQTMDGDRDDLLLMAFQDAENADILSVVAAGNEGTSNRFAQNTPANYSLKLRNKSMITVAATNNLDQLAGFSSFASDMVQVAAPGVNIMSTVPAYIPAYGGAYAAFSGTSMATPHVTGLAVLVWAQNPTMTAAEVRDRIVNTVDILPQLRGYVSSSGRINVKRALAGDLNVNTMPVAQEIPYVISPPKMKANPNGGPTVSQNGSAIEITVDTLPEVDLMTKVTHEGAKEIAVCFSRIDLDDDTLQVLGSNYRMYDELTGNYRDRDFQDQKRELCTASVPGDTVYLRLIRMSGSSARGQYKTSYLKVVQ